MSKACTLICHALKVILFTLCWVALPTNSFCQDSAPPESEVTEADDEEAVGFDFPDKMADGSPIWNFKVFQGQLAALVPRDYRPVSQERFAEAVQKEIEARGGDQDTHLRSAFFDVRLIDDTLICQRDRSELTLETERSGIVRHNLGRCNLAIKSMTTALPRFESDGNGNVIAVVSGDASRSGLSTIKFSWSKRGIPNGIYRDFSLSIPRAPRTRIVLSTPVDVIVETDDCVMKTPAGPPLGAEARSLQVRWYEFEAGGLSKLNLRAYRESESKKADSLVVRDSSLSYRIDASGLRWIHQTTIQTRGGGVLPKLVVSDGIVSSISIRKESNTQLRPGRVMADFDTISIEDGATEIRVLTPLGGAPSTTTTISVVVMGDALVTDIDDWIKLPKLRWAGVDAVQTQMSNQAQLVVEKPLTVVAWQLPKGWLQTPESQGVIRASGPPATFNTGEDESTEWSRVRLVEDNAVQRGETLLELTLSTKANTNVSTLNGRVQITVPVDPERAYPVVVDVEKDWTNMAMSLSNSQRVINVPNQNAQRRITIWPEADDISDGVLVIEATGQRQTASLPQRTDIPSAWMVRLRDTPSEMTAVVIPPQELNWNSDVVLKPDQLAIDDLTEIQTGFFGEIPDEALVFRPAFGESPNLRLQPPDVSFDVRTSLKIERDGSEIVEQLFIEPRSSSQRIKDVVSVMAGSAPDLPPYRWSLRDTDDSLPVNLPSTAVVLDESAELYTISLGERNLRGKRLVGRRQYRFARKPLRFDLPVVPDSGSQAAEVLIGPGLVVTKMTGPVDLVPTDQSKDTTETRRTRLRYDAGGGPTMELAAIDQDSSLAIVWRKDVVITASSRGGDSISATLRVSSSKPIEIDCDPDLQLVSVSLNNSDVNVDSIPQRPIVLPAENGVNLIRLVWNRNLFDNAWLRRCRIPKIEVRGVSVKSSYQLTASHDTFAPVSLFRSSGDSSQDASTINVVMGSSALLIHRNLAFGLGWLMSAFVFAGCWILARISPLIVVAFVALTTTMAILWWPWQLAIVGWLIIPAAAAGLLVTARRWSAKVGSDDLAASDSEVGYDFSYNAVVWPILLILSFSVAANPVAAQSTSISKRKLDPIKILVPMGADGVQKGNKIYIPNSVHQSLFAKSKEDIVANAYVQSAAYRVQLTADRTVEPDVQVDLVVQVPGERSVLVKLPFDPKVVRRVALRQSEQTRILNSTAVEDGLLVPLPPGEEFDLRLTLVPSMEGAGSARQLMISIPPITISQLLVEGERGVQSVHVVKTQGKTVSETALRKWEADLGAVEELLLEYQVSQDGKSVDTAPMMINYWVSIGVEKTNVECEVDPQMTIRAGESIQFEVTGGTPKIISPSWRLLRQSVVSSSRRLITLVKWGESDEPIRLLWQPDSVINDLTSTEDSVPMNIPSLSPVRDNKSSDIYFAIQHDASLRVNESGIIQAIEIEQFLDRWQGYANRGVVDRVFAVSQSAPELTLLKTNAAKPVSTQKHDLFVAENRIELVYEVSIAKNESDVQRRTLLVPDNLQINSLLIDGLPAKVNVFDLDGRRELVIGEEPASIIATGAIARSSSKRQRFVAPEFQLWPPIASVDTYRVSRSQNVVVSIDPSADLETRQLAINEDDLSVGRIPVVQWGNKRDAGDEQKKRPGVRCTVNSKNANFSCSQVLGIAYEDGIWKMQADLELKSAKLPDFLDIEVPKRWCESLLVRPNLVWIQADSSDPSVSLLRISTDGLTSGRLTISGELGNSGVGGISVPQVSVLGNGQRVTFVSVPQNQWKRSGVEPRAIPVERSSRLQLSGKRQEYVVSRRVGGLPWSIELLPKPDVRTSVLATDTKVFLQESNALVVCRWDVVPGPLDAVGVVLPEDAECLGAWAAQQPVSFEKQAAKNNVGKKVVRIPLALSKLAQSVEVLLSVPVQFVKTSAYIPELVLAIADENGNYEQLISQQHWVAVYAPRTAQSESKVVNAIPSINALQDDLPGDQARALALAASVIDAIDLSLETLAERPKGEVATWLIPWASRYESIARSSGHRVRWEVGNDASTEASEIDELTDAEERTDADESAVEPLGLASVRLDRAWVELDDRMRVHLARFLEGGFTSRPPLFTDDQFDGYALTSVESLNLLKPASPIQAVSLGMRDLRTFIRHALTLLMVCGLLMLLWPFRNHVQKLAIHPALWLGILGAFGLFVAPWPVAVAVIIFSVTLPLLAVNASRTS